MGTLLSKLTRLLTSRNKQAPTRKRYLPMLEQLEDRLAPAGGLATIVYQEGMPDPFTGEMYTGTDDVMFEREENRGALPHIGLSSNGNFDYTSLIRFDVTSLENQFLSIRSVTLRLEQTVLLGNGQLGINPLHSTNADWIEGTGGTGPGEPSTSFRKFNTEPWSDVAGNPVNNIFNFPAVADVPSSTNDYLVYERFSVVAGTNDFVFRDPSIVGTWVQGGSANPGLLIHRAGDPTATFFASSEHETVSWRPQLIIEFEPLVDLPAITNVTSSAADRVYQEGAVIPINLTFDTNVFVDTSGGIPTLTLETGGHDGVARYVSGNGSNTLIFDYVVGRGQTSEDLEYKSTALSLNGATIRNAAGTDALLTLPTAGTAGSLGTNKDLVISTTPLLSRVIFQDGLPDPITGEIYTGTEDVDFKIPLSFFPPSGDVNNGAYTSFRVSQDDVIDPRNFFRFDHLALMRFDVTSLAGHLDDVRVSRATLRLNPEVTQNVDELRVFRLEDTNADWIEGDNVNPAFLGSPLADPGEPTTHNRRHSVTPWQNGAGDNVATIFDEGVFVGNRDEPIASAGWNPLTPGNLFILPIPGQFDLDFTDTSFLADWVAGNNSGLLLNAFGTDTLDDFNSMVFSSSESPDIFLRPQLILEFEPASDLTINKSNNASGGQVEVGETFQWTIHIANEGIEDATFDPDNVILRDDLPSGATYSLPSTTNVNGVTVDGISVTSLDDLVSIASSTLLLESDKSSVTIAPGGSFDLVVNVTPTVVGTLQNPRDGGITQVDPGDVVPESDEQNNFGSNTVVVTAGRPDLVVVTTNDTGDNQVDLGETFQWTIEVRNEGTGDAIFPRDSLILEDLLPTSANYGTPKFENPNGITGTLDVSLSNFTLSARSPLGNTVEIAAGGSFQVVFDVTPTATGLLSNPRSGGSFSVDPLGVVLESNETNNDSSDEVVVRSAVLPDLIVSKTNNTTDGRVDVGDTFQWTIRVENVGEGEATFAAGATIFNDLLPDGPTYGAATIVEETKTGVTGEIFASYSNLVNAVVASAGVGEPVTIAPGGRFEVVFDVTPQSPGQLNSLPFTVDPNNLVEESDESNNLASANKLTVFGSVTFVVDTTVDESDGNFRLFDLSLREAIELANESPGPDTITFDPNVFDTPRVIELTLPTGLEITESVTLEGPVGGTLTLDRRGLRGSVLSISGGGDYVVRALNLTGADIGIAASDTSSLTLANVSANGNAQRGIVVSGGQGTVHLVNTEANNNGSDGLVVSDVDSLQIDGGSFLNNPNFGINALDVEDVSLFDVTVIGNGTGALFDTVGSVMDTNGFYGANDDHGMQLIDVVGDVTLLRTQLENNDAENSGAGDGTGDGLNATDGADGDDYAIGGNLRVEGATIRVTDTQFLSQRHGVFVESVAGGVAFRDLDETPLIPNDHQITPLVVSDNELDGIRIESAGAVLVGGGRFIGNQGHGLVLTGITRNPGLVDATGSVQITGSEVAENGTFGILVSNVSHEVDLNRVTARDNGERGIHVNIVVDGDVNLTEVTASSNGTEGIFLQNIINGSVNLLDVTSFGNGSSGLSMGFVKSATDEDGRYRNNAGHGIELIDIPGDVTLTRTILTDNGQDLDGRGDGLNAINIVGDHAIDGNLLVQGATIGNNDPENKTQQNGVVVDSVAGSATFRDLDETPDDPSDNQVTPLVITNNIDRGISIDSAGAVRVDGGTFSGNNGSGLFVNRAASVLISGGSFSDNGVHGIHLQSITDTGAIEEINGGVTLTNVTADSNNGSGLVVDTAAFVVISGGSFSDNGLDGIALHLITDTGAIEEINGGVTLTNVTADSNSTGLSVSDSASVLISGGSFSDNELDGIALQDITDTGAIEEINGGVTLTNVTADSNSTGLVVIESASVLISGGSFSDNESNGIRLLNIRDTGSTEEINGGVTLTNVTADNNGSGLVVFRAASVLISGGSFSDNGGIGISLQTITDTGAIEEINSGVTLTNVTADNNGSGLVVFRAASVLISGGSFSNSEFGSGIRLQSISDPGAAPEIAGVVALTNVTAEGNFVAGGRVNSAGSFSDTGGTYQNNVDHGLELIDITGDVTLTETILASNDADNDDVGDGLHAADGNDTDSHAIGGDLIVEGGNIGLLDPLNDHQERGVFVDSVGGSAVMFQTPTSPLVVTGNEADGVRIGSVGQTAAFFGGFYADNGASAIVLEFANLVGNLVVDQVGGLTSLSLPNLTSIGGNFILTGNSVLNRLTPEGDPLRLESIGGDLTIDDNDPSFEVTFTPPFSMDIGGSVTLGDGHVSLERPTTVVGDVTVDQRGTLTVNSALTAANLIAEPGGTVNGNGIADANEVNNGGTIDIGNSPGKLTFVADYIQSPTGEIIFEITGTTPETEYDVLAVDGNATLAGTIIIEFADGFVPSPGQSFKLFEVTGTLDTSAAIFVVRNAPLGLTVIPDAPGGVITVAPSVTIEGVLAENFEGTTIDLTSKVTNPASTNPHSFVWSVTKDGNPYVGGSSTNFSFTPDDNGVYEVTLTFTDESGSGSDTVIIVVDNLAPTAGIAGLAEGLSGEIVTFTLSARDPSSVDQADVFTYEIDWDGDGQIDQTISGPDGLQVDHTFARGGQYTIHVTATDKDGGTSGSVTHDINVAQALDVDIKPRQINLNGNGVVPTVILSTADFDATTIDIATLSLAGALVDKYSFEDVNGDGVLDLVLKFRRPDLRTAYADALREDLADGELYDKHQSVELTLTGKTHDGTDVFGSVFADLFMTGQKLKKLLETV